jgi:hypothetical protein
MVSNLVGSNVDVTLIVALPDAPSRAVTTPISDTTIVSESDSYLTVCGAKLSTATTGVSCIEAPAVIVAESGETATLTTDGVAGRNITAFAKGETENVFQV